MHEQLEVRLASYPWYFEDWICSETRTGMNLTERGLYRDLLDFCWYYGSLPTDLKTLRKMTQSEPKMFRKATAKVLSCFTILADGRYHHPKVDDKRKELQQLVLFRREIARKGGLARNLSQAKAKLPASCPPSPTPVTSSSSSGSSEPLSKGEIHNTSGPKKAAAPSALSVCASPLKEQSQELAAVLRVFGEFGRGCTQADSKRCERAWAKLTTAERQTVVLHLGNGIPGWRSRPTSKIPHPWNYLEGRYWERDIPRKQPVRSEGEIRQQESLLRVAQLAFGK